MSCTGFPPFEEGMRTNFTYSVLFLILYVYTYNYLIYLKFMIIYRYIITNLQNTCFPLFIFLSLVTLLRMIKCLRCIPLDHFPPHFECDFNFILSH
jgi:hypothetical protein